MQYNNQIEGHVHREIEKVSERSSILIMEGSGHFSFLHLGSVKCPLSIDGGKALAVCDTWIWS